MNSMASGLNAANAAMRLGLVCGYFSATGELEPIFHLFYTAALWNEETLSVNEDLESFYVGLQVRNQLVQLSMDHDKVLSLTTAVAESTANPGLITVAKGILEQLQNLNAKTTEQQEPDQPSVIINKE